jgi:hypothetical protein
MEPILKTAFEAFTTENNSVLVLNFNVSFSIGFCSGLKEHRISAKQKALTLAATCLLEPSK